MIVLQLLNTGDTTNKIKMNKKRLKISVNAPECTDQPIQRVLKPEAQVRRKNNHYHYFCHNFSNFSTKYLNIYVANIDKCLYSTYFKATIRKITLQLLDPEDKRHRNPSKRR
jgi:hypothetical protein